MTAQVEHAIRLIAKATGHQLSMKDIDAWERHLQHLYGESEQERADRQWEDKIVGDGKILTREGYRVIKQMIDEHEREQAQRKVQDMIDGIYNTLIEGTARQEGSVQVYDGY